MSTLKLSPKYIEKQWDEGRPQNGGDGYWISLKSGWKWAGDPIGNVHCIHEDTKTKALRERILPCNCEDCSPK